MRNRAPCRKLPSLSGGLRSLGDSASSNVACPVPSSKYAPARRHLPATALVCGGRHTAFNELTHSHSSYHALASELFRAPLQPPSASGMPRSGRQLTGTRCAGQLRCYSRYPLTKTAHPRGQRPSIAPRCPSWCGRTTVERAEVTGRLLDQHHLGTYHEMRAVGDRLEAQRQPPPQTYGASGPSTGAGLPSIKQGHLNSEQSIPGSRILCSSDTCVVSVI